jgi:hypothetical protein
VPAPVMAEQLQSGAPAAESFAHIREEAERVHAQAQATKHDRKAMQIDFAKFETRSRCIAQLRALAEEAQKLAAAIGAYVREVEAVHREDVQLIQEHLDGSSDRESASQPASKPQLAPAGKSAAPWADSATTNRALWGGAQPASKPQLAPAGKSAAPWADSATTNRALWGGAQPASKPQLAPAPKWHINRRNVPLAEGVSLEAQVIPAAVWDAREVYEKVGAGGLYYIAAWDHFAARCGPMVFHGNIGKIYPVAEHGAPRTPALVKECRSRGQCASLRPDGPPCTYYHDPLECPGSRDVRNFIADAFLYLPPTVPGARRGRRIGSRDSLATDLADITASDARRFIAQTAHDILCSLLLAKYALAGG